MNEKNQTHIIVLGLISFAVLGLIVESLTQGWEFWVPPLLIAGVVGMWALHITQYMDVGFREAFYLVFSLFATLFHGVHSTSLFDIVVINVLVMVCFSLLSNITFLRIILIEYVILMATQLVININTGAVLMDGLNISRIILHTAVDFGVYIVCSTTVRRRLDTETALSEKDKQMKKADSDTEDFLVNISHELRTPVNVVNGISTIILKNEQSENVSIIRDAGMRLAHQIEDMQDFTDIKRGDITLENEKYMITSLINDVLSSFSAQEKKDMLEFIVDLSPSVPTMMRGDIKKLHKVIRHLIDNAMKFTRRGGVYVKISTIKREYGVNLEIEVADTGKGMSRKDVAFASRGLYQADKKRDRSTGGIGLGLNIVYGFVHKMNGFVTIQSARGKGTTVRISIPQEVIDPSPCLKVETEKAKEIIFHVNPEKYKVPQIREFYRQMAVSIAAGLHLNLYSAVTIPDIQKLLEKKEITHIFMGPEEYDANPDFFDDLSRKGVAVSVSAPSGFRTRPGSGVIVMPKPLYGYPVTKILNEGNDVHDLSIEEREEKPDLSGLRTLIVDDEPMNLVVATGIFRQYNMVTDTASSGKESIEKFAAQDYDVIFMDHMMPEMDGVEAMKRLKNYAHENGKKVKIIALTANAVSGARQMFMREGFDAFISKPIDINTFERTMLGLFPNSASGRRGGDER